MNNVENIERYDVRVVKRRMRKMSIKCIRERDRFVEYRDAVNMNTCGRYFQKQGGMYIEMPEQYPRDKKIYQYDIQDMEKVVWRIERPGQS